MYLDIRKPISDLKQTIKITSHIVVWFWFKWFFFVEVIYCRVHLVINMEAAECGGCCRKSWSWLCGGRVVWGYRAAGRSAGYCGWPHFRLLRAWEVTVLPVKLDTAPQNLWILTCVSVLNMQPSFPMFSPYYWIYISQTKVPFIFFIFFTPFLQDGRKTLLPNEKTRDSYFSVKS